VKGSKDVNTNLYSTLHELTLCTYNTNSKFQVSSDVSEISKNRKN